MALEGGEGALSAPQRACTEEQAPSACKERRHNQLWAEPSRGFYSVSKTVIMGTQGAMRYLEKRE